MLNEVNLIGRLGKDPELRYTQNGSAVANLNIATDESYTGQDGNKVEKTEWHRVIAFGKTAENVAKFKKKGELLLIKGSLQTRKWQDKEGQDRWTTEIKAMRIVFLPSGSGGNGNGQQAAQNQPPMPTEAGGMDDAPF